MAKKNSTVITKEDAVHVGKSIAPIEKGLEEKLRERITNLQIIKVVDAETHRLAGERWKEIIAAEKEWDKYWEEDVENAHKTWKGLVAKRDALKVSLAAKKLEQTNSAKAWKMEEDRKTAELQRKAQEEARKQAQDEAMAKAAALEKEGRVEEAAAVIGSPIQTPAVVVQSSVPKGFGGMTRTTWSAKVTDMMALVKAVAEGKAPIQCIEANMVFLNAQARAMHEALAYPGVVAEEK